jgi:hypothetical protein
MSYPNDLYRRTRSKSVTPSVSLDQSIYTEEEKQEIEKYGATIKDLSKELIDTADDIFKFTNASVYDYVMELIPKDIQKTAEDVFYR